MKKCLSTVIALSLVALFSACDPSGSSDSEAAEAAAVYQDMDDTLFSEINYKVFLDATSEEDIVLPGGVSFVYDENGGTLTFTDYNVNGFIFNGTITVRMDDTGVIPGASLGEETGVSILHMECSIEVSGVETHSLAYDYTMEMDVETYATSFSGSMTVDGKTFDINTIMSYES